MRIISISQGGGGLQTRRMPSSKHKPPGQPLSACVLVSQHLEIKARLTLPPPASVITTDAEVPHSQLGLDVSCVRHTSERRNALRT